jgi:hypothetical protein
MHAAQRAQSRRCRIPKCKVAKVICTSRFGAVSAKVFVTEWVKSVFVLGARSLLFQHMRDL